MADDFRDVQEMTCAGCGLEIGQLVDVAGEDLVQIGGLIVSEIDGNCVRCGEAFHYSLNARRLERLVRRGVERRGGENDFRQHEIT